MRNAEVYSNQIADKLKEALQEKYGNIEGKRKNFKLENIHIGEILQPDDYAKQRHVIANRGTYGTGVYADVSLTDKSGQIIDKRNKMKIGFLPTVTNRNTFIINGKEYTVNNQLRLKPGIYTKVDRNELASADFNLAKGRNLSIKYDPAKGQLVTKVANSHIPLYSLLKDVYKVPDSTLKTTFGDEYHKQEMENFQNNPKNLQKFYKIFVDEKGHPDINVMGEAVRNKLDKTEMSGTINKMTLGKAYTKVNPESLLHAAKTVLNIHKGLEDPSLKDNLAFKSVHSTEDFLHEKLTKMAPLANLQLKPKIDNAHKVTDVMFPIKLKGLINDFFVKSNMVAFPMQINPMEMLENSHKITTLGEGGISDTNALPGEARNIHASFAGFIDPVRTPDNMRAGVDNRIAIGAWKDGNTLKTFARDRNGKYVQVTPEMLYDKTYAFLNEQPIAGLYKAFRRGHMELVTKDAIDYFLEPSVMFTATTGTIPFTENTHPQRGAMGAKMLTQALSLVDREPRLVKTSASDIINHAFIPKAKVSGVIEKIEPDIIHIKDEKGVVHQHNVPNNFALNYHSYLHFDPSVKEGQTVKEGQLLGDHNFSKNGEMSLGKNLNVAFMPYKGWNYEDAIILTQQGADKLKSNHIFQEELDIPDKTVIVDRGKFLAYHSEKFNSGQLSKLDGAVIRKGEKVSHGDPLILALKDRRLTPEAGVSERLSSKIMNPFNDIAVVWDKDYPGEVIDVIKTPSFVKVIVKAISPMVLASKLAGSYGNKGVVGLIIPNNEAPRKLNGEIPDVILNPAGLSSRKNVGQLYETGLGKVIKQKGLEPKTWLPFTSVNTYKDVKSEMEKHGVKSTDTYYDPISKKHIPDVFNGYQYFLKLVKEAETGYSARAGGEYNIDRIPLKGGEEGSKSIGALDLYGYLGHKMGSPALLGAASTYKAEYNPEFWSAILSGQVPPPPKPTFAYTKFLNMMKGMGVNVTQQGNDLQLLPWTDKSIMEHSKGEITKPLIVMAKNDPKTGLPFRPEAGGLFDPAKTGGLQGTNWNHVNLAEPVANTLFAKPIRTLLNLKVDDYNKIAEGEKTLNVDGHELTGGSAFKAALAKIDVNKELDKIQAELGTVKSLSKKNDLIKKQKVLKPLKINGFKPNDVYILNKIPVIPPIYRPVYPKENNEVVVSDANHLYKELIDMNNKFNSPYLKSLTLKDQHKQEAYKGLNTVVKKLQGLDGASDEINFSNEREPRGFLKTIVGSNAKYGYFQRKLLNKAQDIAGRAVITGNPKIGMDQVGMPEPMAWKMYGGFVTGDLVNHGYSLPQATEMIQKRDSLAKNFLQNQLSKRLLLVNRAPTLHKFNVVALKPFLVQGKYLEMPQLIFKGLGMDADGDQATTLVPATEAEVKEAHNLLPSNNLFKPLKSEPIHVPDQETTIGLHQITNPAESKNSHIFNTFEDVLRAYKAGKIHVTDKVEIKQ